MEDSIQTPTPNITPSPPPASPPVPSQSNSPKKQITLILLGVMILMLIVTGVLVYRLLTASQTQPPPVNLTLPVQTPIISPEPEISTVSATTGDSDLQLNKDTQTIDKTLDNLDKELQQVDAGLNDQSIDLSP